jgi:hypothetical protein
MSAGRLRRAPTALRREIGAVYDRGVLAAKRVRWRWPVTRPHYFDFGEHRELVGRDLVRPEAWDALRTRTTGVFGLPGSRAEWERFADRQTEIAERARAIDALLAARRVSSLASYGVGAAMLELWLTRLSPERRLLVGEYAPATIERLRAVFQEAEVRHHDLLAEPPLEAGWHLFHRIDTEFSDEQWRGILERFAGAHILFAASDLLTPERDAIEVQARKRGGSWAGYLRNRPAFEALWRATHEAEPVQLHDLPGWVLIPRGGPAGGASP